jgi:hypothetical protein
METADIDIRLEPQLLEKLDAWCARQPLPPSRMAAIVHIIEFFLATEPPLDELVWRWLLNKG